MMDIRNEIIRLASINVSALKIEIRLGLEPYTIYKSKLYHQALMTGYQNYFKDHAFKRTRKTSNKVKGDQ